jgi:hypothetical protein
MNDKDQIKNEFVKLGLSLLEFERTKKLPENIAKARARKIEDGKKLDAARKAFRNS